jgi:recombination protein RecA
VANKFVVHNSGKTTLCLHTVAACQSAGGSCAYIDAEHALDVNYAKRLGVDTANLLLAQPDYGEQGLEIAESLTSSSAIDLIVVDSVAALVPRSEIEGGMGDATMAVQARLMSQAMRKLTGIVSKTNTILIFINQLRSKIGVPFGNPETTTGGNALKFYASVRIDIRRVASIKEENVVVGSKTKVKVVKSKVSPPFTEGEIEIYYNKGISHATELIDLGVMTKTITQAGAWFTYGGDRYQGKQQLIEKLNSYPELMESLAVEVFLALKVNRK